MMPTFVEIIPRLPVKDLRRTIEFYTDCVGFKPDVVWPEDRPTFAILRRDSTSLGFFEPNEHRGGPIGYAELYIHVNDSVAFHEAIQAKTRIEWGPETYSYGRREFAFRDPDDYLVIITEPTEESPTTNEPGLAQIN
jgi:catechol 2,3-dioxygenase-like lactoylglutathione lyase family enzyme